MIQASSLSRFNQIQTYKLISALVCQLIQNQLCFLQFSFGSPVLNRKTCSNFFQCHLTLRIHSYEFSKINLHEICFKKEHLNFSIQKLIQSKTNEIFGQQ